MKKNNGFTLIELLAVILILGIIALIAIPTVNSILKESRVGAWKSTASQMTKAAENYFQLKQIKNQDFVVDFKTSRANNDKFFTAKGETSATGTAKPASTVSYDIMLEALSLKGDIPKETDIKVFQINQNGAVALAFDNANAYCMTVEGSGEFTSAEYNAVTSAAASTTFDSSGMYGSTKLKIGGTAVCIAKQ